MKKYIGILCLFCGIGMHISAQFYKSLLPSPGFTNALEKIVLDFRLDYKTIQGNLQLQQGEYETYVSAVHLPGAKECLIYRFHSMIDTTASWQAVMYQGEDHAAALNAYKNLYRLIHKSVLHWIDHSAVTFTGDLDEPGDNARFAETILTLDLSDHRYEHFVAKIELFGDMTQWMVRLALHNKRDDRSRE